MFTGETTISTINDKGGIVRSKKIKTPEGKLVFNFNKNDMQWLFRRNNAGQPCCWGVELMIIQ